MIERMRKAARRCAVAGMVGLALVAGLAGCGGAHGPGGSKAGKAPGAGAAATVTAAPTATQNTGPGAWRTLTGCANAPDAVRVRYAASVEEQKGGPTQVSLRRSDDCGATWTNLNPPAIPGVSYATNVDTMTIFASPLNAQTAFLMVQAEPGQGCVITFAHICQPQFVTVDGGVTWTPLSTPVPGILGVMYNTDPTEGPLPHAQNSRLYGRVTATIIASSGVLPPGRLVASDDGGLTWHVADAPLAAQGLGIWDYAVAPSGSMVFVAAEPVNDSASQPPNYGVTLSFWASPDGGVTWSQAANPPGVTPQAPVLAMGAGVTPGGQTAVYAAVAGQSGVKVWGSLDGGATWQTDARLAITASTPSSDPVFAGSLADGSAIIVFPTGGPTLAWLPGSPPRAIAAGINMEMITIPVIQQSNGATYLWLLGALPTGSVTDPTVEYTQLTL